jgi:hypothetical protein
MAVSRNVSKQVQKLEERLIPTDEPMVIHVKYVSLDGSVTDGSPEDAYGKWKALPR